MSNGMSKEEDFSEFVKVYRALYQMKGRTPTDTMAKMMFAGLQEYSLLQVKKGFLSYMKDTTQAKSWAGMEPSDIIRHMGGGGDEKSSLAWSQLVSAIRRFGPYKSIVMEDKIALTAVSRIGGWVNLCNQLEKSLVFKRNDFVREYKELMREQGANLLDRLPGYAECKNGGSLTKNDVARIGFDNGVKQLEVK